METKNKSMKTITILLIVAEILSCSGAIALKKKESLYLTEQLVDGMEWLFETSRRWFKMGSKVVVALIVVVVAVIGVVVKVIKKK